MPTMTLESLRKAVTAKYEPLTIDMGEAGSFDFVQPLRLGDKDFRALNKAQSELSKLGSIEEPTDDHGKPIPLTPEQEEEAFNTRSRMVEKMRELLLIPANDKAKCQQWLDLIGDDAAGLMELIETYMDSSQVGEA